MKKSFTVFVILGNIIMCLVLFLSSQGLLVELASGYTNPNPLIVREANIFTFTVSQFSAPSYSGFPPVPSFSPNSNSGAQRLNVSFFVFICTLILNVVFIVILLRNKEKPDEIPIPKNF